MGVASLDPQPLSFSVTCHCYLRVQNTIPARSCVMCKGGFHNVLCYLKKQRMIAAGDLIQNLANVMNSRRWIMRDEACVGVVCAVNRTRTAPRLLFLHCNRITSLQFEMKLFTGSLLLKRSLCLCRGKPRATGSVYFFCKIVKRPPTH